MNIDKYVCFLSLVALGSLAVSAECKPGYQSARVVKVLAVSAGPSAPVRADEESPQPAKGARLVIFGAGGKQYGLRLPPGSDLSVATGDQVCFRKEGKTIRVETDNGKQLPGVAHPVREMPQTQ
ncbi:MAG TPA: hypothetical protein VMT05_14120 [Terriglobales bacterium]|jgi:hypothetical protein|nr:hypothetical protein [Terriglobales bacterium]